MRTTVIAGLMGVMMVVAAVHVAAQVAGTTTLGVPATEITTLAQRVEREEADSRQARIQ